MLLEVKRCLAETIDNCSRVISHGVTWGLLREHSVRLNPKNHPKLRVEAALLTLEDETTPGRNRKVQAD
jgi:hypothetical protein